MIAVVAAVIILAILFIKYKVVYKVTISGEEVGYVLNKNKFEKLIDEEIINPEESNVAYVDIAEFPKYEIVFTDNSKETNEGEIFAKISETAVTTYKLYAIAVDGNNSVYVNSIEEAEETVTKIKEEYNGKLDKINISVNQIYTQNINEVEYTTISNIVNLQGGKSKNGYFILAILAAVITFLSQFMMERSNKLKSKNANTIANQSMEQSMQISMKIMKFIMPVIMISFVLRSSASFGIYILASNVAAIGFGEICNLIINKLTKQKQQEVEEVLEKEAQRLIKKGKLQEKK